MKSPQLIAGGFVSVCCKGAITHTKRVVLMPYPAQSATTKPRLAVKAIIT